MVAVFQHSLVIVVHRDKPSRHSLWRQMRRKSNSFL